MPTHWTPSPKGVCVCVAPYTNRPSACAGRSTASFNEFAVTLALPSALMLAAYRSG
jgi:hypothetical protein